MSDQEITTATPRAPLVVSNIIPVFDTAKFEHMYRVARVMAASNLIPEHFSKGGTELTAAANCFHVVNQANSWGMDPFFLLQQTYVVHGKFGFSGQAIAAAINSDPDMKDQLDYTYYGKEGTLERGVVVSGKLKGHKASREVRGTVKMWHTTEKDNKTMSSAWRSDPDQMLAYRGARTWARRHNPSRIMGIYSDDEIEGMRADRAKDITPRAEDVVAPEKPAEILPSEEPAAGPVADEVEDAVYEDADILPPSKEEPVKESGKKAAPEADRKKARELKEAQDTEEAKTDPTPPEEAAAVDDDADIMPPAQSAPVDDFPGDVAVSPEDDSNFIEQAMFELGECLNLEAVGEWIQNYSDAVQGGSSKERWAELSEIIDEAEAKHTQE